MSKLCSGDSRSVTFRPQWKRRLKVLTFISAEKADCAHLHLELTNLCLFSLLYYGSAMCDLSVKETADVRTQSINLKK